MPAGAGGGGGLLLLSFEDYFTCRLTPSKAAQRLTLERRLRSGRVALVLSHPGLPQIRTCGSPASGSSDVGLRYEMLDDASSRQRVPTKEFVETLPAPSWSRSCRAADEPPSPDPEDLELESSE